MEWQQAERRAIRRACLGSLLDEAEVDYSELGHLLVAKMLGSVGVAKIDVPVS